MRPLQARLVTLCQQVLALGVVLVVLTPASGVVSLDIVGEAPGAPAAAPAAPARADVGDRPHEGGDAERHRGAAHRRRRRRSPVSAGARSRAVPPRHAWSAPRSRWTRFGAVGVTWQSGEELEEDQITLRVRTRSGDEWSAWEDLEYHDEHGPDAGQRRGRERPPRHRAHVRRRRRRRPGRGPHRRRRPAGRPLPRPGRPGVAPTRTETEAPADTADEDPSASYDDDYAQQDSTDAASEGITLQAARKQTVAQPTIYSPRPVGRRREHPQQERAALRHDQRRLRPPHGQRQRLHRGPGARAPAQHLRLPREVEGLERHRLQLPRRPLRSHLGGSLRRHRQARRRRPHAQLQRLLLRDVGDRQLRHRPAARRDAARLRPALRVEAVAARRQPGVDVAEDRSRHVPGDQRAPRRRLHRLPGQVPLRPAAADPDVRLPGRAGGHAAAPADRGAHRRARSRRTTWTPRPTRTSSCGAPPTAAAWCCRPVA